jgi:hypothetical protein
MNRMNAGIAQPQDLEIFRTGRSRLLDDLACEQAVINHVNETDMPEQEAAKLNAGSFKNRGERIFFVNQYRRHVRNLAEGNRFYQ